MRIDTSKKSTGYWIILTALCSCITIALILMAEALLMTLFDADVGRASVLATVALCIGSFAGGWILCLKFRHKVLIHGVIFGFCLGLTIVLIGILLRGMSFQMSGIIHLIAATLSGGIGGIAGLNRHTKKHFKFPK